MSRRAATFSSFLTDLSVASATLTNGTPITHFSIAGRWNLRSASIPNSFCATNSCWMARLIRINRAIQHEFVAQNEFGIEADLRFQRRAFEKWVIGVPLVNVAEATDKSVRNELNVAARRDMLQASQRSCLV